MPIAAAAVSAVLQGSLHPVYGTVCLKSQLLPENSLHGLLMKASDRPPVYRFKTNQITAQKLILTLLQAPFRGF
jgi:hypothetical protein